VKWPIAAVRIERCGLEHQRIPAATADVEVAVGIGRQADVTGFQAWDFLLGDFDGAIQTDPRRRAAVGRDRHASRDMAGMIGSLDMEMWLSNSSA
jgi:hypothetical protein